MDSFEKKVALRKEIRQFQKSFTKEQLDNSSQMIVKQMMSLPEYRKAKKIFCFVGIQREIDTSSLIQHALQQGKQVAVPLCTGEGIMEAHCITSLEELTEGSYGIPEPSPELPLMLPEDTELAVIPCISCDRNGFRLGQGGGYYDRYLKKANFARVCLCRELLLSAEIPTEPWDSRMDLVVTERVIYRMPE